jgi:outer membrane protein insertion porin family
MKRSGWALGILVAIFLASAGWAQTDVISEIDVQGNRRIPAETVRARIFTHPGDIYDPSALERDFNALWNTGYFEDIRFSREQTPKGWRLIIQVKEKPTIREINYVGLSSVTTSDVLDRFKEAKVGLSVESQYDPTKIKKAEVTIKGLLSRTPVFHHQNRSPANSSRRCWHHLCHQRRPESKSRQDQVRRQQER